MTVFLLLPPPTPVILLKASAKQTDKKREVLQSTSVWV